MHNGFFITGTDTEIGKTEVTAALLSLYRKQGFEVVGMKPVASGCLEMPEGLRSEDALKIRAVSSVELPYAHTNPYAFAPAIAPHLAAAEVGARIESRVILDARDRLSSPGRLVFVEGVGGWLVPLDGQWGVEDLARALDLPVVLVVGMRLGCLNHAMLSERAILASGCAMAGWVANYFDGPFPRAEENLETLRQHMKTPMLGVLPFVSGADPDALSRHFDWSVLEQGRHRSGRDLQKRPSRR